MNRMFTACLILVTAALPAFAHGFWVNASAWLLDTAADDHDTAPNETLIYLGFGHFYPIHERVNEDEIVRFEARGSDGSTTALDVESTGIVTSTFKPEKPGAYIVTVQFGSHFFTVYDKDGKTEYSDGPKSDFENVEYSSYNEEYGKAFMRTVGGDGAYLTKPIGDSLELVPTLDPYALQSGSDTVLPVQVLFKGKPLAGATVFATNAAHYPRNEFAQRITTDAEGIAKVTLDVKGPWLLKVEHTEPIREEWKDKADEEEYHATASFEVCK